MVTSRKLGQCLTAGVLALATLAVGGSRVQAAPVTLTTLSMRGLTNNSATNTATGVAQLTTEVQCDSAATANQVSFIFRNSGSSEIKIHEVYFDDDGLLQNLKLRDADDSVNGTFGESGVDYSPLANPAEVPGANNADPDFVTTTGFSADTDTPQPNQNAVGPGESLTVFFSLVSGKTCANVLSDLQTGKLRVAQHVGSFADGGSESFINNPPTPPDTAKPVCGTVTTGRDEAGRPYAQVPVQDTGSGIKSIVLTSNAVNVTLSTNPSTLVEGTTSIVTARGTKINTSTSARFEILITDMAGNSIVCDPIETVVVRENGEPVTQTHTNVLQELGYVKVMNRGLKNLTINVNGKQFTVAGLRAEEVRMIDIRSAMKAGANNTISLTAYGTPGTAADIMIWDGQ